MQGFKDFIMRGNVVELAVAVVIGSAFAAVVNKVVENLINPILAAVGGADASGLGFHLREGNPATFMDFGAIITALLTFLITAAVVYFVFVLPMNTFNERRGVVAAQTDSEVLAEIRDLLKTNRGL
ncbi:large conductance mechanosensitive channel protein MscL [Kytococcus sedentarius]|uniref:large conductance mechanosensitive channel protein MscL n=1 Tax=Kytococcus sedentarius TaxID=1276 RepID=UPI000968A3E2|nr:large conductance mechanosensitive channel protein MscL [Kytococcus sedentarius]OLT32598.1 mechanosensitive ion channel protein MscL [Kytococcus sp. CUA-901]QRO87059.1 large conductance mechanosensitive channel protein MscL [Kytococcus sedentarius]